MPSTNDTRPAAIDTLSPVSAYTELRAGRPHSLRPSGSAQSCVRAFDGGGSVTAGDDGVLYVWDAQRLVGQLKAEETAEERAEEAAGALSDEFGAAWGVGRERKIKGKGDAVCSMHLAWVHLENWVAEEPRLVTGHASGRMRWWAPGMAG